MASDRIFIKQSMKKLATGKPLNEDKNLLMSTKLPKETKKLAFVIVAVTWYVENLQNLERVPFDYIELCRANITHSQNTTCRTIACF